MSLLFAISLPTLLLCILLAGAVWHDVRRRRIPNLLAGAARWRPCCCMPC